MVATFGLVAMILGCLRFRPEAVPTAVGLYITSAYWFTSSTNFANPAVTIARALSDTFAGIRPTDAAPAFVVAQLVGAALAAGAYAWLFAAPRHKAAPAARPPHARRTPAARPHLTLKHRRPVPRRARRHPDVIPHPAHRRRA